MAYRNPRPSDAGILDPSLSGSNSSSSVPNSARNPGRNSSSSSEEVYVDHSRKELHDKMLNDPIYQLLMSTAQTPDQQSAARDSYMAYYLQLQAEKRAQSYDNPANQLRLLMAAGMSRDAALRAIGFIGSNAVSSPVAQGLSPSETAINNEALSNSTFQQDLQSKSFIFNSVAGIMSMASAGLGIAQGVQQMAIGQYSLQNAAHSSQALQASTALGAAIQNNFSPAGVSLPESQKPSKEDWSSYQNMLNYVQNTDNPNVVAWREKYPDAANTPYFFDYVHSLYRNNVQDRGYKELEEDAEFYSKLLQLRAMQEQLNFDNDFLNYQWKNNQYEDYLNVREVCNAISLQNFKNELEILTSISDPQMLQYKIDKLRNDAEFNSVASFMQTQRANYVKGQYENDPVTRQIMNSCSILDQYGFGNDMVGSAIKAANIGFDILGNETVSDSLIDRVVDTAGNALDAVVPSGLGNTIYNYVMKRKERHNHGSGSNRKF